MINPNSAPPVEDPDHLQDKLGVPYYRQAPQDQIELDIVELMMITRPDVLQGQLAYIALIGASGAISALTDQLEN
ncbi:MAG TPA: hypothetical protein VNG32_01405 [Candidatus Dormibacteraeota bacterium]|nr:hypothetical protein [Candidatus Dormibacteraeota bacterium]